MFALACGHPLDPPTPHGYIDPSSTVVETEPSDEPPSVRDPHIPAPTATVIGTAHTPGATPLQTPRVRGEWLPSSSDRLGFLSADYKRYSIWDAKVVGLHCSQTRCLAATRHGGLFETSSLGDWRPLTTSLPTLERGSHVPLMAVTRSLLRAMMHDGIGEIFTARAAYITASVSMVRRPSYWIAGSCASDRLVTGSVDGSSCLSTTHVCSSPMKSLYSFSAIQAWLYPIGLPPILRCCQ